MLHEAKDAGEIHVNDREPILFRVFGGGSAANDAGIIDEDIDSSEMLDGLFYEARTDFRQANIAHERDGFCAGGFELVQRGFRGLAGAMHGDVGAGLRQGCRDGRAQAARRAGDQSGLAFEIELVEN
jgi:hypothetical protein